MTLGVLADLTARSGWTWKQLWTVAPRVVEKGHGGLQPLSVYLDQGVVPRAERADNHNSLGADLDGYLRVLPGDVVFNKLRTWQGGLGVSRYEGIVSPAYFVCRAASRVEPRFLHYLLRSAPYLAELTRLSKWMPPSQFDIPWDALRKLPLLLPPLDTQRRIADFLDDQVALLDLAIGCRSDQIDLVRERAASVFDAELSSMGFQQPQVLAPDWTLVLRPEGWRVMRLSRVLRQLTNGYVGPTRDILRDTGVRYIQGTHIKNGQIDFDRRPFHVDLSWHVARRRINLRPGDVLIVQTGDIGQVAVVPPDFGEASCHALLIARVNESVVSGRYLGAYLRSAYGYQSLISRATGALHPHLEGGIRDVPVVVPPLDVQDSIVHRVDHHQNMCTSAVEQMGLQVAAFQERKQAVITAAVTGQFDVTTARSVA